MANPPSSPPTLFGIEDVDEVLAESDSPLCFCSCASCSCDFTASTETAVRMGVPSILPPSALILARAGFNIGYMAVAAAMS